MKNKILLSFVLFSCLLATSCNDWLDVQPKSQVKDNELFSSEPGFKEALSGVYSTLVSNSLYKKELRFGMLGVLAREWSGYQGTSSGYGDDEDYEYTAAVPERRIAAFWDDMYFAIANANSLIRELDETDVSFTGNNYEIIKGEAYALRAFIHFELLRLFGVSMAVNPNQPSIPYVTEYNSLVSPQLTVAQVIARVLDDLEIAEGLLRKDPIFTGETITEQDDNGYLINRQLHLNYYAVKGLQARVHLYRGDYTTAESCAEEVIGSGKFTWVSNADWVQGKDPSEASEQLWGIDVNDLSTIARDYFSESGENNFRLDDTRLNLYYEDTNISDDYRFSYGFTYAETSLKSGQIYIDKFNTPSLANGDSDDPAYYSNKMSMIKLSEMYYILAECRYQDGGDYLEPINEVRRARGLQDITSDPVNYLSFLTSEFRKDFLGEGQLWFFYKRHNIEYIYGTDANMVTLKHYTFPLPQSELSGANRQDNR